MSVLISLIGACVRNRATGDQQLNLVPDSQFTDGSSEALERVCDYGMEAADHRKSGCEKRFQGIELLRKRACLEQPLPSFARPATTNISERRVSPRQLVRWNAKQELGGARPQLRTHRTRGLRDIADHKGRPSTADDGLAHRPSHQIIQIVQHSKGRIGKAKGQVHQASRQHPLMVRSRGF